jgi:hypothetical protein
MWLSLLCVLVSASAGAQTTEATSVSRSVKSGEIVSISGHRVLLKEADGLHEYTVPEGYKFQMGGRDVTIAELKPGMKVNAVIDDKTTVRDVTTTTTINGTVKQVAPGGIVVMTSNNELKSYDFKDADGNDVRLNVDGKDVSLRSVKVGDRLSGTIVTKYGPQTITQRSVRTAVSEPPPEPSAPVAAAAPAKKLPHTASPLPLLGLLAGASLLTALGLRAARLRR